MAGQPLKYYIDLLESGELVAFPTETVYGLGARADNPTAVKKIFDLKGRPTDNPLIVHVSNRAMVSAFARNIPESAKVLMDKFWPGPLTLIFKKKDQVLDLITAGMDTVAIRMPDHDTALSLIDGAGPLVAPSANKSGRPSPTLPQHVRTDFGESLPVIEDQPTRIGIESTVLDLTEEPYCILRPGAVTLEQIQEVIDHPVVLTRDKKRLGEEETRSPGMKYTHYAPRASVRWLSKTETDIMPTCLYLIHSGHHPLLEENTDKNTPPSIINYNQDYDQLARELYDRFRQADQQGFKQIAIEAFSEKTLESRQITVALKNRILKAIGK